MLPEIRKLNEGSPRGGAETTDEIASGGSFTLKHIKSFGDQSEPGYWYDQDEVEWVALVSGSATLEFEQGILELTAGDSITIPPHLKHRVAATSPDAVWIALHYA